MEQELNDQMIQRQKNAARLVEMGITPYPYSFDVTHKSQEIKDNEETLVTSLNVVKVAGRVMAYRGKGKTAFAHIKDMQGKIQIYMRKDGLGDINYEVAQLIDLGDIIGVTGTVFRTHTGELTINASTIEMLSKAIRPVPIPKEKEVNGEKVIFDEFNNPEQCYRQRYLDLILNENTKKTFITRTKIIKSIRNFLDNLGYLEVETPTLQTIYGGASARPFQTHHNALDINLYMRISNELYLKRLLVGGLERVYEIVKNFRNEGIDRTHNPEFTMIEFYESYSDYNTMMNRFEQVYYQTAMDIFGTGKITYQGTEIDLTPPWKRITLTDCVSQKLGKDANTMQADEFAKILSDAGEEVPKHLTWGTGINAVFSALCEKDLIQPTFIMDHPKETTPLCKAKRGDARLVERFEPYINGWEIGNAYSELNDPKAQYELLKEQVERGRGGEAETHPMDYDFLRAMEFGMPPAGGVGIGIDRMVMLFTNSYSIRDVLLFPMMKPE